MSTIVKDLVGGSKAKGEIRAGGTDLMERLRHGITSGDVVDISRIPDMRNIVFQADGGVKIGALVTVHDLATHPRIQVDYPGLALAAAALATPQIRRAASVGGALLQRNRCAYYRHEEMSCFKKGGNSCPAREGNHQFGVCFDLGPCVSPHPSTLGMALLAYDPILEVHGKGPLKIKDLFGDGSDPKRDHTLDEGEILISIFLPPTEEGEMSAYFRSISRARAEWPLVEVLVRGFWRNNVIANCRVVVGGVANIPLELTAVGEFLNGKVPSEDLFTKAATMAIVGAKPLRDTQYKIQQLKGSVYHTLFEAFTMSVPENQLIED